MPESLRTGGPGRTGEALVLGGGITGMQAALDLARAGARVHLVTREPSLGGKTAQLDKVFPVTECAMCLLGPRLEECRNHPLITVHPSSELVGVAGEAGSFAVTIARQAPYVDPDSCTGCGECEAVCPVEVPDAQDSGLRSRKVIHKPFAQAVPPAYTILAADAGACSECRRCEAVCRPRAINIDAKPLEYRLDVGAVVVATGFEFYDPALGGQYGYGHFPNVVTSMEFERLISPTGPGAGVLTRPSDGRRPRRIAFIQCVGSRQSPGTWGGGSEQCSSICCMYSIKQAIMARELDAEAQSEIYLLDLRAFGKGFERYAESAATDWGVTYTRQMVSSVREAPDGDLIIRHGAPEDPRQLAEDRYDMVVLAVGLVPPPGTAELADRLGVPLGPGGFLASSGLEPGRTPREGIFVAGAAQGPCDLVEAILGGSAAAAAAAPLVTAGQPTAAPPRRSSGERGQGAAGAPAGSEGVPEAPRIGVFVCRCGADLEACVDVEALVAAAGAVDAVAIAHEDDFSCTERGLAAMREACQTHALNRVVVAACSPHTHRAFFATALAGAGLDAGAIEIVNLRDHCARVHRNQPELALMKAKDMVRMAIARVKRQAGTVLPPVPVTRRGLVVGGGLAGMTAALTLASSGVPVDLIEHDTELGGNLRHLHHGPEGEDFQAALRDTIRKIDGSALITVHLGSRVVASSGHVGRFSTVIEDVASGQRKSLDHGAAIIATGARETSGVTKYLRGQDPRVLSSLEFERLLASDRAAIKNASRLVFIQCAGTRTPERPYCSRTCCVETVKAALEVKGRHPSHQVFVLYRDVRTFGQHEVLYRQARDAGVIFLRYEPDAEPLVSSGASGAPLTVTLREPAAQLELRIPVDNVILALGMEPRPESSGLAEILHLPLDADGFLGDFLVKPGPADLSIPGIFLCGLCHAPKLVDESIIQARAAAARAATVLMHAELQPGLAVAIVEPELCAACLTCVRLCPYHVPVINRDGDAEIDSLACRGCGTCAAECPAKAISLACYSDEQMIAQVAAFGGEQGE